MSRDGVTFPLSLTLIEDFTEGVSSVEEYYGSITVLSSISGLITLLPDGSIKGVNGTFSRFLFGYDRTQLLGKNITFLIPGFYQYIRSAEEELSLLTPPQDLRAPARSCEVLYCSVPATETSVQRCKSDDSLEGVQHPACRIVVSPSSPQSTGTAVGQHQFASTSLPDQCSLGMPACCLSPGTPTQDEQWDREPAVRKCMLHDLLPGVDMEPLTHCLKGLSLTGSYNQQKAIDVKMLNHSPDACPGLEHDGNSPCQHCTSTMKKINPPPNPAPVTAQVAPLLSCSMFSSVTPSGCTKPSENLHHDTPLPSVDVPESNNFTCTAQDVICNSPLISNPPLCHSSPVNSKQSSLKRNYFKNTDHLPQNSSLPLSTPCPEHSAEDVYEEVIPSTNTETVQSPLCTHLSADSEPEQNIDGLDCDLPNRPPERPSSHNGIAKPHREEYSQVTSTPVRNGSTCSLVLKSTNRSHDLFLTTSSNNGEIKEGIFSGCCHHQDGSRLCKNFFLNFMLHTDICSKIS
ncbi:hypothetical protein AB205_0115730 [Aquarana catesbeiana]|uniref:PAS domain-containing protein n=1 Tax=Aquarana catesbeiana TaxID=8400 RepID=A0A2G9QL69_AQUCT|nr:hypothetical protein AB205_0115730 [Aquarana catesbeiana]